MYDTPYNPKPSGKTLRTLLQELDPLKEGRAAYALIKALYPVCRSITGDGVRESLRLLQTVAAALPKAQS